MSTLPKVHSLTGRITYKVMEDAFRAVRRNKGSPGVDEITIGMFEANLKENLLSLMKDLKTGALRPKPVLRVYIDKDPLNSEKRPLGIPTVRDRVAQEVLRRLLTPIFEPTFHDDSYGYRLKRSCHMALRRLLDLHKQGYKEVLNADVKGFFDNISQKLIMEAIAAKVADGNILRLIQRFLTAGVMENGKLRPTTKGVPQGGVFSPLAANIVLNHLDWRLEEAGYCFVRYADDFIVLGRKRKQMQEALKLVEHVLEKELELQLSPGKTAITTYGKGYEFLGFFMSAHSRRMRDKSLKKFKDKIRKLTIRKHNFAKEVIEKLNRVIRGVANYFATDFATMRSRFQLLDSWIRMRLRCMKKKRKRATDNSKIRCSYFGRKLGLLTLEQYCWTKDVRGQACRVIPRRWGTLSGGRP